MNWLAKILDWVFPRTCVGCELLGCDVCESCWRKVRIRRRQQCPQCRNWSKDGKICCQSEFFFDQLLVAAEYRRGDVLSKLIVRFKYKFAVEVVKKLGALLGEMGNSEGFVVVAVPLDQKKLKLRGFNQAELLARFLGEPAQVLRRKYKKVRQAGASREERLNNLEGLFELCGDVAGRKILLVDDVATTGTTLNQCAKVLKEAGAKYVCGIVLARGR